MDPNRSRRPPPLPPGLASVPRYVLCYLLFVVLVGLSYAGFILWQPTSLRLIGAALGDSYANQFLQDVSVVFLGFVLFGLLIAGEPYLRDGVAKRRLGRRFLRLALILVGLIALESGLQELLIHLRG